MTPTGQTNLWAGLQKGLEELRDNGEPGRLQHIMLFTDGLPNINPPRGIVPMTERFKKSAGKNFFGGRLPTINTFGFGYELDSELLSQLAILGSGSYAFIPDAGFVGTVFVNAMTNLIVTQAKDVELTLEPINGASFAPGQPPFLGGHPLPCGAGVATVSMGTLQFGQPARMVVQMTVPPGAAEGGYLKATVKFAHRGTEKDGALVTKECIGKANEPVDVNLVAAERLRLKTVDTLRSVMAAVKLTNADKLQEKELPLPTGQELVARMVAEIDASPCAAEEHIQYLKEDLTGQVTEALTRAEWYTRWGIHYLPSLLFAHQKQQCNNFKDAGVQSYGGNLFLELREKADEIFINMPPPTPTAAAPATVHAGGPPIAIQAAPIARPVADMSAYYSSAGG